MMRPLQEPRHADAAQLELQRWSGAFAGTTYYYGSEPGPVARRAVRYHRDFLATGGTALDAGCGEGQDLAFLAERGYEATGIEFTPAGAAKSQRMLQERGLHAEVLQQDLRQVDPPATYDLVLAVNSLQFMAEDGLNCLRKLMALTSPGGVMGLSLFAREPHEAPVRGTVWFVTFDEVMQWFSGWQPLEAARLWQWSGGQPQPFVTLIARKI